MCIAAVHVHGLEVSSSAVRALVAAGDMRRARWMLGRPFARALHAGARTRHRFAAAGAHGQSGGLRRACCRPSASMSTRLTIGDRCFQAVTNVGNRPTFEGAGFSVESHILDFRAGRDERGDAAGTRVSAAAAAGDRVAFAGSAEGADLQGCARRSGISGCARCQPAGSASELGVRRD